MRIRRSSGFSWDRSVIAAAPPSQQLLGLSFMNGRHPGDPLRLNPNSGSVYPACASGVALFGGLFCRPPPPARVRVLACFGSQCPNLILEMAPSKGPTAEIIPAPIHPSSTDIAIRNGPSATAEKLEPSSCAQPYAGDTLRSGIGPRPYRMNRSEPPGTPCADRSVPGNCTVQIWHSAHQAIFSLGRCLRLGSEKAGAQVQAVGHHKKRYE
jgi:hypothetical protein